jgi:organic radical activating enzyme
MTVRGFDKLPTVTATKVATAPRADGRKFAHPNVTANGEKRARVAFTGYQTVWVNTGTLCNIACQNCYIESSPRNDRLTYLTRAEVRQFLDEAASLPQPPAEIGFTGGEPFMNPDFLDMVEDSLGGGFRVLVLTNAMKPLQHFKTGLLDLNRGFPGQLSLRVSLDHYIPAQHECIRGVNTWQPAIDGLQWLARNDFDVSVAGRSAWAETEASMRAGYGKLFEDLKLSIDARDPQRLVLFPEMDEQADVPEITERCWGILGKSPADVMCASSRMIIKRKGADRPTVVSCTLLPYSQEFEMGSSLAAAVRPVALNHPHCARFCVLGGASCSVHK